MRLIDADRFLSQIEDQYREHDITRSQYVDFEDRIMQQPTIEPEPQWIPCSERLPEIGGLYIVCGKQKYTWENDWSYFVDAAECVEQDEGYIDCWTTWNDWDEGQENHIIAWMPLPEPYTEDADA